MLTDKLQQQVMLAALTDAHVVANPNQLPASVREKSGVNGKGKTLHYLLNYSGEPQHFTYSEKSGTDLLSGKSVASAQAIELAPWDLVIVEEK